MLRSTYIQGEEVVACLDLDLLAVARHCEHMSGNKWRGDLLELELVFIISHLRVTVSWTKCMVKEAVREFVKHAQQRCPEGKQEGIMAEVDRKFFDVFEELGFQKVCAHLCQTGELVATWHLLWPESITPERVQAMRAHIFGKPAMSYCSRCENAWGSDVPQIVDKCDKCSVLSRIEAT